MGIDVLGNEKPVYYEGQEVLFDLDGTVKGWGIIRGRGAAENIVDMWIVEIKQASGIDRKVYPWSCLVMPHHQIKANPYGKAAFRFIKIDPNGDLTEAWLGAVLTEAHICCKNCTIVVGKSLGAQVMAILGTEVEPLNKAAEDIVAAARAAHPQSFEYAERDRNVNA